MSPEAAHIQVVDSLVASVVVEVSVLVAAIAAAAAAAAAAAVVVAVVVAAVESNPLSISSPSPRTEAYNLPEKGILNSRSQMASGGVGNKLGLWNTS